MDFTIDTEQFSGPLQLLLELIEAEELPITEVSLAHVTDDFLQYINQNEVPSEELADFLLVATKLLYIKSKALLPVLEFEEEEAGAEQLAEQLRMYKAFVQASEHIEKLHRATNAMFVRAPIVIEEEPEFRPPEALESADLANAFGRLLKRLRPFFKLQEESVERVVSVKERLSEMREAIMERSRLRFTDVVKGSSSKVEVVVSFLALLELMKQRVVSVVQGGTFEDITIKHVD